MWWIVALAVLAAALFGWVLAWDSAACGSNGPLRDYEKF